MQGTSQYIQALSEVKTAVVESLIESFQQGNLTSEEYNQKILNLISTMEDLQKVWSVLDTEGLRNSLMSVASQYEICSARISDYAQAISQTDEAQGTSEEKAMAMAEATAAMALARTAYSAELA